MFMSGSVHLVIPCFRESGRLKDFLNELCHEMDALGDVKILVVEDGSGDEEQARMKLIVEAARQTHSCLLPMMALPHNEGKGGAVYEGWARHQSEDWLGFVDADGSCPAKEVARLICLLRNGCEANQVPSALFASRVKLLGNPVERDFKRHVLGRVYATLVSELLDIPVYDSQCGLKLVPRAAYESISHSLQVRGFAFDVELLVALLDASCGVKEIPIRWHEVAGGKVHLLKDSWRMFRDVLAIRSRRKLGAFILRGHAERGVATS